MKKVLSVFIEEDGSLSVMVEPIIGMMFDDRDEVFASFDSEKIADETQNLLNALGKKIKENLK